MSNTSPLKELLAAMGVIKNADPKLVSALADDAAVEKALDSGRTAEKLTDGQMVDDHWAAGHTDKSATKEEVKVGPTQEASGGGAEKMIGDYSSPARQMHGVASVPEKLDAMLGRLGAVGKAIESLANAQKATFEALGKNNTLLVTMISEAAKGTKPAVEAKKGEDEEDEEDEESEVVEINEGKAKKSLRQAKALIKARDAKKAEMEEEEEEEKCKALKAEIKSLEKQIAKILGKARTAAYAASSDELKKSVRMVATKADINVVQEEEEEEDEEEEGKSRKSETPAADTSKAKTDDKGHQADTMDSSNGNQSAAAKAEAEAFKTKLDGALKGIEILSTDIRGMMDVVAGKSKVIDHTVIKSAGDVDTGSLMDKISAAEESGQINAIDAMGARDIASKLTLAKAGKIDIAFVNDRILKTTSAVRAIFNESKAA